MRIFPFGSYFRKVRVGFITALAVGVFVHAHGQQEDAESLQRQANLQALKDPFIPGVMPTFYSPGQKARAKFLQDMLSGETRFFHEKFGVDFAAISLAVLTPEQWPNVADGLPYGIPSMTPGRPYIFIMPSDWRSSTAFPFPEKADFDPATLRRALAGGDTWETLKFAGGDGIGTHEIGHSVIRQLRIDPQTYWFNEFLASYAGYAYLKAEYPKQLPGYEAM